MQLLLTNPIVIQHEEVSGGSMPVLKSVIYQFSVIVDSFKSGEWCGGKVVEIMNQFNGLIW